MKRRSFHRAYESIRPDDDAKARMLKNILLSSEIPPAGKDERLMRKNMKPLIIAAMIGLMIILMGCAVVGMRLQDMKIGEFTTGYGEILDSAGNIVKETELVKDVISLQGFGNSPSMLAAREWLEFEEAYEVDGQLIGDAEAAGYVAPREYDAYFVYDQTMQDKVDEIASKYGLKLAGKIAYVQEYQNDIFFDALNINSLHHEDAPVEVEYRGGYFYECGNFNMNFYVTLTEADQWPHKILTDMRYNGKEYLDTVFASVANMETVEQWHHTTADGTDVLIIMGEGFARLFCDREDAFLTSSFTTDYESDTGQIQYMTKADVEAVADALDFRVEPQKPDMDVVTELLEQSEKEHLLEEKHNGYFGDYSAYDDEYGYLEFIEAGIAAAKYPEKNYFALVDIDGNGVMDLLLGNKEQCTNAWTNINPNGFEQIAYMQLTEDELNALNDKWTNMDIKPITEYISE